MRKIVLILVATATVGVASAQLNIKLGVSGSKFSGDPYYDDQTTYTAPYIGLGYDIDLKKIIIQPEVKLTTFGSKRDKKGFDEAQRVNVVSFGSLVGWKYKHFLRLFTGVEVGIVYDSELSQDDVPILGIALTDPVDTEEYISSTVFTVPIGISFVINRLMIEGRYNIGLSNIIAEDSLEDNDGEAIIDLQDGSNVKMNGFQVGLAFSF